VVTGALVAAGVALEVELVVLLGVPPLTGGQDLGDDAAAPPLLVGRVSYLARDARLLVAVREDTRPVLRAHVGPLRVARRRVVHPVEELEQLLVRDALGVVDEPRRLGVCGDANVRLACLVFSVVVVVVVVAEAERARSIGS
jgi:hypothetical protein